IAEPTTADVSLSPSFLRTATTPKHTADRIGSDSRPIRKPSRLPPSESSVVPATITTVPITIGTVMRSPSSAIASAEDTKGFRLISAAAIEAPTFSIATNRRRRPPTVPIRPPPRQGARRGGRERRLGVGRGGRGRGAAPRDRHDWGGAPADGADQTGAH